MDIEKIKYARQLEGGKEALEVKLSAVNELIEENQNACSEHITLITKGSDSFPHYGSRFRCLLCGRSLSNASRFSINARDYLTDRYDDRIESQRNEKFDMIQTMALGIMTPDMSEEEFVDRLNTMIQDAIALKRQTSDLNEKQLIKK